MYNDKNTSTTTSKSQTYDNYHSESVCLLSSCRVHVLQAKWLARRARAASMGPDHNACLKQLLDGLDRLNSSLGWLTANGIDSESSSAMSAAGGVQ
jgi:hypothetical protein